MSRSCQRTTFSSPTERGRAHDAREPADPLGDLRVALVRHRRGALHALRERLLDLAHLGSREMADLGREPLERRRGQRERGEQLGVAVARDHLRRERIRLEPEPLAGDPLDLGVEAGVASRPCRRAGRRGSTRARARAGRGRGRARRPSRRASSRTSSARRGSRACARCRSCGGAPRPAHDRVDRAVEPGEDQLAGVLDLERERRVDDVRGGEAVVDPATLGPELLGDGVDERGGVVVGRSARSRRRARRRRRRAGADRGDVGGGDRSELGPAVERGELDLEPARELALLRPDLRISGRE